MRNKYRVLPLILILFTVCCLAIPGQLKAQENSVLAEYSPLYLEKLIATAKENYPRLKSFDSQVNSAKADLSTVKASWLDPFSFQYVTRSNQTNTNAVNLTTADILSGYQFGVSINPGSLLQKPSQVKKAKELIKVAEANLAEYHLQLESEVKRRYFLYLQNKKSLTTTTNALLDAESNLKNLRIKYERAEVPFEQYNVASVAFNDAALNKIQVEAGLLMAKAALEELTVRKLEEIK